MRCSARSTGSNLFRPEALHFSRRIQLRGLVLNHVPVLDEQPVLETNDIGSDPVNRRAKTRETAMDHHEISPGDDDACLILQRGRKALDQIEQALPARLNMIAVLNVVR